MNRTDDICLCYDSSCIQRISYCNLPCSQYNGCMATPYNPSTRHYRPPWAAHGRVSNTGFGTPRIVSLNGCPPHTKYLLRSVAQLLSQLRGKRVSLTQALTFAIDKALADLPTSRTANGPQWLTVPATIQCRPLVELGPYRPTISRVPYATYMDIHKLAAWLSTKRIPLYVAYNHALAQAYYNLG